MAQAGADQDVPLTVLKERRETGEGFYGVFEDSPDLVSAPPAPGDGRRIQLGVKMASIKGADN